MTIVNALLSRMGDMLLWGIINFVQSALSE
jgi:hypothetical protein